MSSFMFRKCKWLLLRADFSYFSNLDNCLEVGTLVNLVRVEGLLRLHKKVWYGSRTPH